MADDTDPWTKRFQNIDKLMTQPASAPAASTTSAAPPAAASTSSDASPPSGGWGHDVANAIVGGMYAGLGNITRNITGGSVVPPPLPQDTQQAMAAHPYFTGAGNLVAAAPVAIGAGMGAPLLGAGLVGDVATGAATGAAQNILAGNPDESFGSRAATGAALGGVLGGVANKVGGWFGAGRSIEPQVADAAKVAQKEGVTDIGLSNLPGGNVKAMGATPTYAQSGQIDNAVSKILGDDVPNFNSTNFNKVQSNLGSAVSKAANSGQINAASGGAFDQALTQVEQFANSSGVGGKIAPLINQIRGKVKNGIISGQDFDNLVGNGSVLHDLVGNDDPYVKQAAQALDKVMDAGFQASSPAGAYDNWVDARTKYRMLMGVQKAILPNGHINPTTLFNSIQSRFTDLKGTPVSTDPLLGRMGQFADSVRTLFGGGAAPSQAKPSLLQALGAGTAGGGAAELIPQIVSGNIANPENYLTPAALAGLGAAGVTLGGRYLGNLYQQSRPFVNALIDAGGAPIGNPLTSPAVIAPAVQAFPQRRP